MSRDESYVLIKKSPIVLSRHLETWNGVVLSSLQGPVIRTFVTVCHRACHCAHGPYIFYSCHQFFSHPSFLIISFVPPTYPLRTGITGVHHTTFLACFVNTCSSNHSVPNEFSFFFSCSVYAESFAKPYFPYMSPIENETNRAFLPITDSVWCDSMGEKCSSLVEHWSTFWKALGSSLSTSKLRKTEQSKRL